jgi:hypothetical protein
MCRGAYRMSIEGADESSQVEAGNIGDGQFGDPGFGEHGHEDLSFVYRFALCLKAARNSSG